MTSKRQLRSFTNKGARLQYEVRGSGRPLVLLHGNGEDHLLFDQMAADLESDFMLITPDTRGHGGSSAGRLPMDFALFADDLRALLAHLGLSSAHILGFSDGGNTALHIGWMYPAYVSSLMVLGANMTPCGIKPEYQIPILLGYGLCSLASLLDSRADQAKTTMELMVRQPNLQAHQLALISAPTLVMAGEMDMVKTSETLRIAANIPNSKLIIVPDANHFLPISQPQTVNTYIRDFLATIP